MKLTTVIFCIFSFFFFACGNEPTEDNVQDDTEQETAVLPDSVRIAAIDQYKLGVRKKNLNNAFSEQRLKPHIFSDKDSGLVLRDSGQIVRAGFRTIGDTLEEMIVYYFKGGEMAFVDSREWHKQGDTPYATQIYAYFDERGKIFSAQNRSLQLSPGQPPMQLVNEPLVDAATKEDSISKILKDKWQGYLEIINANR